MQIDEATAQWMLYADHNIGYGNLVELEPGQWWVEHTDVPQIYMNVQVPWQTGQWGPSDEIVGMWINPYHLVDENGQALMVPVDGMLKV